MSSREGFRFRDDFIVEQGRDLSGRMRMDRIFGTAHPAEQRLCGYSCSLEGLIPAGKGCAQPALHRCQRGQQTPLVSIPEGKGCAQPCSSPVSEGTANSAAQPLTTTFPLCIPSAPHFLWFPSPPQILCAALSSSLSQ